VFTELKKERIMVEKDSQEVQGAMGCTTTSIAVINSGFEVIEKLINLINFWKKSRRINNIHYKVKDGMEVKLNNLTDQEIRESIETLRNNFDQLEFISIGKE